MNPVMDGLLDKWDELKSAVRKHWDKLTDDDFAGLRGRTDELASLLQQRYGYARAQAVLEINNWLDGYDQLSGK